MTDGTVEADLRVSLLKAQAELRERNIPVMVVISGPVGSGRGDTIKKLNEWMDARFLKTRAFHRPDKRDRSRPGMWRYWLVTPAAGEFSLFVDSWYEDYFHRAMQKSVKATRRNLEEIRNFEKTLIDSGVVLLKFWLNLSADEQRQRFSKWEDSKENQWRIENDDQKRLQREEKYPDVYGRTLTATDQPGSEWINVDASDLDETPVQVGLRLKHDLDAALGSERSSADREVKYVPCSRSVLAETDLSDRIDKDDYQKKLKKQQSEFAEAVRDLYRRREAAVFVFEGWDAAGKGGAIRRMVRTVDPRQYRIIPIGAPDAVEKAHHYLWRFWREIPRSGHLTIFDRSWYGRVLVERVEGFATESQWQRAFDEINEFEAELTDHGIRVIKFWLHISDEEQLRRFEARQITPHKVHKITREDFRNRERRRDYELAFEDMYGHTHCDEAPWVIIPAEDKRCARIDVLTHAVKALS